MADSAPVTRAASRPSVSASRPARSSRTRDIVIAGLMAGVMAVLGPMAVAVGTVPVTLQVFPVVLAALLLRWQWAGAAMSVYLALGAIGVPVYAHGTAGLGVLLGPTGGFLVGFVAGAAAGALVRPLLASRLRGILADSIAALFVVGVVYLCGWAWLSLGPTHMPPLGALAAGVVPFVVPDAVKAAVAVLVALAVRRATRD